MSENEKKVMALMALAANFGKEFPECLLPVWLDLLAPYPAGLVNEGVKQVILTYEYKTIPPFAVLKREIDKSAGQVSEEEKLDLAAEAEWNMLIEKTHSHGSFRNPEFCATTAYVLRGMGGWDAACRWETAKLEWRRKEFKEAWKLAYGKEDVMELGATAVLSLISGQTAIGTMQTAIDMSMKELPA